MKTLNSKARRFDIKVRPAECRRGRKAQRPTWMHTKRAAERECRHADLVGLGV